MAFSWNPFNRNRQQYQASEHIIKNPNQEIFSNAGSDIEQAVSLRSVVTSQNTKNFVANPLFQTISDCMAIIPVVTDKQERIKQYRSMAMFPECSWCIREICDEFIHENENGECITLKVPDGKPNLNDERVKILKSEFNKYINMFNLRDDGYNLIQRFVVEGELAFENIINSNKPELGIVGVKFLPAEYYQTLIDQRSSRPVGIFFDVRKFGQDLSLVLSQSYMGSQQIFNSMLVSTTPSFNRSDCIPLMWPQVTYISSELVSPDGLINFSLLENVKQAYHQLSLLQDSAVILRVTRAPERLLFNVSTGKMSQHYADEYVRNFSMSLKAKKTVGKDGKGGSDIASVYNPMSMLENYVFGRSDANDGTSIESVSSTANYEQMADVEYFLRRLMKQFNVPFTRYKTPENTVEKNDQISQEEYSFLRQIIRFQRRFSLGFKRGYITHLKLRGIWDKYSLRESDINIEMVKPTLYDIFNTQKLVDAKMATYKSIIDNEEFSKISAMKKILGMTDAEINENFKNLIKENQLVKLANFYGDKLGSEGPAKFESPIPIKGLDDKGNPLPEDNNENEGNEGDEGDEEKSTSAKSEEAPEEETPDKPTFGLS